VKRAFLVGIGLVALAVVVVVGLFSAREDAPDEPAAKGPDLAAQRARLAGAPAPLAALYRDASELLDGGEEAFEKRLEALRGHPVVVNKWASWCGPCRVEFPHFREQALKRGKEIAFIGVNSGDVDSDAERFLRDNPVPYPSYRDPDFEIAQLMRANGPFPQTVFYDSAGRIAYIRQGQYRTEADLAEDIERYAK